MWIRQLSKEQDEQLLHLVNVFVGCLVLLLYVGSLLVKPFSDNIQVQ